MTALYKKEAGVFLTRLIVIPFQSFERQTKWLEQHVSESSEHDETLQVISGAKKLIKDSELYGFHGYFDEDRQSGQKFLCSR
jgi:hypothetical protein